jgi:hypothetical protein
MTTSLFTHSKQKVYGMKWSFSNWKSFKLKQNNQICFNKLNNRKRLFQKNGGKKIVLIFFRFSP